MNIHLPGRLRGQRAGFAAILAIVLLAIFASVGLTYFSLVDNRRPQSYSYAKQQEIRQETESKQAFMSCMVPLAAVPADAIARGAGAAHRVLADDLGVPDFLNAGLHIAGLPEIHPSAFEHPNRGEHRSPVSKGHQDRGPDLR